MRSGGRARRDGQVAERSFDLRQRVTFRLLFSVPDGLGLRGLVKGAKVWVASNRLNGRLFGFGFCRFQGLRVPRGLELGPGDVERRTGRRVRGSLVHQTPRAVAAPVQEGEDVKRRGGEKNKQKKALCVTSDSSDVFHRVRDNI